MHWQRHFVMLIAINEKVIKKSLSSSNFAFRMGTGASKKNARATVNAGIVASKWMTNTRSSTRESIAINIGVGDEAEDPGNVKDIKAKSVGR